MHNCLFQADLARMYVTHVGFCFPHVFGSSAANPEVYKDVARPSPGSEAQSVGRRRVGVAAKARRPKLAMVSALGLEAQPGGVAVVSPSPPHPAYPGAPATRPPLWHGGA